MRIRKEVLTDKQLILDAIFDDLMQLPRHELAHVIIDKMSDDDIRFYLECAKEEKTA